MARDPKDDVRRTARMRAVTACVTAGAVVAAGIVAAFDGRVDPWGLLVAFMIAEAVSWGSTFRLQPKGESEVWQLDEAIFVCALVLLPPLGVVLVFAFGV